MCAPMPDLSYSFSSLCFVLSVSDPRYHLWHGMADEQRSGNKRGTLRFFGSLLLLHRKNLYGSQTQRGDPLHPKIQPSVCLSSRPTPPPTKVVQILETKMIFSKPRRIKCTPKTTTKTRLRPENVPNIQARPPLWNLSVCQ